VHLGEAQLEMHRSGGRPARCKGTYLLTYLAIASLYSFSALASSSLKRSWLGFRGLTVAGAAVPTSAAGAASGAVVVSAMIASNRRWSTRRRKSPEARGSDLDSATQVSLQVLM